jgi:hypothetical protein
MLNNNLKMLVEQTNKNLTEGLGVQHRFNTDEIGDQDPYDAVNSSDSAELEPSVGVGNLPTLEEVMRKIDPSERASAQEMAMMMQQLGKKPSEIAMSLAKKYSV